MLMYDDTLQILIEAEDNETAIDELVEELMTTPGYVLDEIIFEPIIDHGVMMTAFCRDLDVI